jgi:hypothetical protein
MVVPTGKVDPDDGSQDTVGSGSALSVAFVTKTNPSLSSNEIVTLFGTDKVGFS